MSKRKDNKFPKTIFVYWNEDGDYFWLNMDFDFDQLLRDLQKIQVKLDEGFVDEAEDLLDFVINEISIKANQSGIGA